MPTFDSPTPISVQLDLYVGDALLRASDRSDTVVVVRPSNVASKSDIAAAEQTLVEYADGQLSIKVPKGWRRYSLFGSGPSVDIVIELPSGSSLHGEAAWASVRSEGRLGACHLKTGKSVRLAETGPLDIDSSTGDVTIDRIVGRAGITSGTGKVRVREIDGPAVVKNSTGGCWIGQAAGDLHLKTAYGDIEVDRALGAITANTAYGGIRIDEVVRGSLVLQTSYGDIEVGIRTGTAAWLDVSSKSGRVHNTLDASTGPGEATETTEVRARTSYGQIVIRRA